MKRLGGSKIALVITISFIFTMITGLFNISAESPTPTQSTLDIKAANWNLTAGYTSAQDKTNAVEFTGTTAYGEGVTYKNEVDVSVEVAFDIKFTEQQLATGSGWVAFTLGKDGTSFNNPGKGVTFILYKKNENAIECGQNIGPWWDFPFSSINTIKVKKGALGWELYFKNSILTNDKKVATIPFTTVPESTFVNYKAKLSIYSCNTVANSIKFEVSNLTHYASTVVDNQPVLNAYDLKTYTIPYWKGDTVYQESVMFVKNSDGTIPSEPLLYVPTEILSVRSSDLQTEYKEGIDWILENGRIKIPVGSSIPVINYNYYYPVQAISGQTFPKVGGGNIAFSEGTYWHQNQIAVSYKHSAGWTGKIPIFKGADLPKTMSKLLNKEALKIVFYGDSITTGANSSNKIGTAPYAAQWPDMVVEGLKANYGYTSITSVNTAVGGTSSKWGADNAQANVVDENPDLVVIGFGMNDGSGKVPPSDFIDNIQSIMKTTKTANPNAEFVLVSTTLPNPEVQITVGNQAKYEDELLKLEGAGIAVAEITSAHKYLLSIKHFHDMTGNNVNHPNDFLARLYAQTILSNLINTGTVQTLEYPEKTYILPSNNSYWNCLGSSTYSNGVLAINDNSSAVYTGSKLTNKLAQFNMTYNIPNGKWVGFLLRLAKIGAAPWEQSHSYFVIIKSDGTIELIKYLNSSPSLLTSKVITGFDPNQTTLKTIRVGAVDENGSVRIIFEIDGKSCLSFLDTTNPILDEGNFSVIGLETANAKLYLGPKGTDDAGNQITPGKIEGMGYTGGAIIEGIVNRADITDDADLYNVPYEKANIPIPDTGDNSITTLWLAFIAALAFSILTVAKKKNMGNSQQIDTRNLEEYL